VQVERVDSTMRLARELLADGRAEPFMVVAAEQTGGYGTRGRTWQSPIGGLWSTTVWPLNTPHLQSTLSLRAGLACLRTITHELGNTAHVKLKWPNDILIRGRKVCGILCEVINHHQHPLALIGIGMNINNLARDLPPDLRRPATSLSEECGRTIDISQICNTLANELVDALDTTSVQTILEAIAPNLWRLDDTIRILTHTGESHPAILRGLTMLGRPLIELDGQRIPLPESAEIIDPDPS